MEERFIQNVRMLLRDLSARLQYGVVCEACGGEMKSGRLTAVDVTEWDGDLRPMCDIVVDEETLETERHEIDGLRPYLYPLDKYIWKHRDEMEKCGAIAPFLGAREDGTGYAIPGAPVAYIGYCLEHHVDYLGLIDIGWAIEVTEENDPYKKKIPGQVTLEDIKARPLVEVAWKGYMEGCLSDWNIRVCRDRMSTESGIRHNIADMVQDGNEPRSNEDMLTRARWYIEKKVYTDEQWEKYFLPAINEMITYNDAFVRFMPGYVVRHKESGRLYVVEYDYATGFGSSCGRECRDFTSLSLCRLYDDGHVDGGWCWARYEDFELVDKDHTEENIAKVREYNVSNGHKPPYYLDSRIERMYYR